jgi:hypothetical protein
MKSIGEYEEYQPIEARPVREMRAVLECLGNDGYHLGPPRKREPSALVASFGVPANKVVRTEKVGSGGYSSLVKKQLKTGFPQLDAYGEARKEVAWKAIEGFYRRQKAERKKVDDSETPADTAARDAVRCLEHAMVIVAGEKVSGRLFAPMLGRCALMVLLTPHVFNVLRRLCLKPFWLHPQQRPRTMMLHLLLRFIRRGASQLSRMLQQVS